MAQEILAAVPRVEGCPFMFTSTGNTAVSGWSMAKRKLDAMMKSARAGACTICAEQPSLAWPNSPYGLIELVVNHVSGSRGGVAGVYNKSELMPERWAAHVQGLMTPRPGNVIDLPHKARHK